MYAKFAARTPGIGQCQAIHRANPAGEGCERSLGGRMARHYCALPKGTRQAGRWQTAAHWLCRGLRIATGARPPRLTRGATGVSLWAAPGHGKAARRGRLGDGSNRSVRSRLRTSRRTLPCRSLRQERTCRVGYEVVKVKTRLSRTKQSRPGYFERSRGRSDRRRQGCVGSPLPDGD